MPDNAPPAITIPTGYGDVELSFFARPASMGAATSARWGRQELAALEPATIAAHLGGVLTINGVEYRPEGWIARPTKGPGEWVEDRSGGWYLHIRRVDRDGFPMFGDGTDPTSKAREAFYGAVVPLIFASLRRSDAIEPVVADAMRRAAAELADDARLEADRLRAIVAELERIANNAGAIVAGEMTSEAAR